MEVEISRKDADKWYMVSSKVTYFMGGALRPIQEYWMLFFVSAGLDIADASWIRGVELIGGAIASPLWGILADKSRHHKRIAVFLCVMSMLTVSTQPFVTEMFGNNSKTVCPRGNMPNISGNYADTSSDLSFTRKRETKLFYSLLVTQTILSIFDRSLPTFIESGVMHRVRTSPIPCKYGHQQMFDTIGRGIGALIYSAAIDNFPEGTISCYCGMFIVYLIMATFLSISFHCLFNGICMLSTGDESLTTKEIKDLLGPVLTDAEWIVVFLSVLITGVLTSLWFSFLFLYLKELNAPTMLLGMSITVGMSVSGSITYMFSNRIINLLRGNINTIGFTFLCWFLRFFSLSYIQNPYFILPIQILHGLTFSLSAAAYLNCIRNRSDERMFATMCSIKNALLIIGFIIGNIIGGKVYKEYGGQKLFLWASLVCASSCIVITTFVIWKHIRGIMLRNAYERIST